MPRLRDGAGRGTCPAEETNTCEFVYNTGELGLGGCPDGIGLVGAAGLAEGRYVIDIDAESDHIVSVSLAVCGS